MTDESVSVQAPIVSETVRSPVATKRPDYDPLFAWVVEREATRARKEGGEDAPYTADPIIGAYRFCNVRREDDRGTVWIRDNIRKSFADSPELWLMLCIGRQINWPETLYELIESGDGWPGDTFDLTMLRHVLDERKALGKKVYTGAYMISAPPQKGRSKQDYMAKTVIGHLWEQRDRFAEWFSYPHRTLAKTHERLSRYVGWGDFMAYQAVVDMRFTRLLDGAPDIETWCAAGPGTIRGLNRLHGRPVKHNLGQDQARSEIRAIWKVVRQETGVDMDFSDVPNCLCETDKYLRVQNGEGVPRALYVPGRGC